MRLVMMGTGTFAEPTFQALLGGPHEVVGLVTQPDRAAGQERGSTRQTGHGMKNLAVERGVPVFQPDSVNTPEGVAGRISAKASVRLSPDIRADADTVLVELNTLQRTVGGKVFAIAVDEDFEIGGTTQTLTLPRGPYLKVAVIGLPLA